MPTKTCFKCHATKPIEEFYAHPKMADGRLGKCKECTKADVKARPKHLTRAYDRRRAQTQERKMAMRQKNERLRERFPEKLKARQQVGNAVRDGRLEKSPCGRCGSIESVEGHHHDYSRPLDVEWLCGNCHRAEHHPGYAPTPF